MNSVTINANTSVGFFMVLILAISPSHANDIPIDMNILHCNIGINASIRINRNTDMQYCWFQYVTKTNIISNVDARVDLA